MKNQLLAAILPFCVCIVAFSACNRSEASWTGEETELIMADTTVMRVLQFTDKEDAAVLRKLSADIPAVLLKSDVWRTLSAKMLETVRDGENPGVGIAGPQVGISRRVVAVQRFDKEGEPFEIYPNVRILAARGERVSGPEGCLSVPDRRGEVLRWQDIDIAYTSPATLADTVETVKGYTAVIFQHECDHLDGLVFTDRLTAQDDPQRIADDIRVCLDKEDGQYALGETVTVTAGMLGVYDKAVEMTVMVFGKPVEKRSLGHIGIRDTVYVSTPSEATAVMLEFRPEGETPDELPKDVNMDEDQFRIGFIVGAETFRPGNARPDDVMDFWNGQVAMMREDPMVPLVSEVAVSPGDSAAVECFDVELNAPDGIPVRGYYARPRNAESGSCAIVIQFHAAGIEGNWCRAKVKDAVKYARKGAICFDFNALGMLNGQDEEYYKAQAQGPLKGYSSRPLEDKESYFFKDMVLRAVRGLDYAAQDPAWDGRTVLVLGESQGGFQSAMLAGIDSRVTDVIVNVPAGVGTGGELLGRSRAWPYVFENSGLTDYALENAGCFDAAVLLEGCKAKCLVEVGLIDTTCPPAEIFSGFNAVSGEVRYITTPYRPHHLNKVASQYRPWWDENISRVRHEAIDSVINQAGCALNDSSRRMRKN